LEQLSCSCPRLVVVVPDDTLFKHACPHQHL
jgi:hypothetical protein